MVLDSSTVMTPSLPTFSMASAMSPPISGSSAEIAATWAIASLVSTGLLIFLSSSTMRRNRLVDPPLERERARRRRRRS